MVYISFFSPFKVDKKMSRVNKNRKFNILDAYHQREIGMSNRHHITQELLATAEDRLVTKEHNELVCIFL